MTANRLPDAYLSITDFGLGILPGGSAGITAKVCAGIDEEAADNAEAKKDDEERDAFGYAPEERAALDEQVGRMSEKYRAEIEKMREDFKGFK